MEEFLFIILLSIITDKNAIDEIFPYTPQKIAIKEILMKISLDELIEVMNEWERRLNAYIAYGGD